MKIVFEELEKQEEKITSSVFAGFLKKNNLNPDLILSIFSVADVKMASLNNKYRKLNKSTDVLSFPIWNKKSDIPKNGVVNLGDIFYCKEEVLKNAKENNLSYEEEFQNIISHSLNHLIGKHHKE